MITLKDLCQELCDKYAFQIYEFHKMYPKHNLSQIGVIDGYNREWTINFWMELTRLRGKNNLPLGDYNGIIINTFLNKIKFKPGIVAQIEDI